MPSKPPKLKLLPFKLDPHLIEKIDEARGSKSRSFFMREALAAYLNSLGIPVSDDMIYAPDRTGGISYASTLPTSNSRLNEDPAPYSSTQKANRPS